MMLNDFSLEGCNFWRVAIIHLRGSDSSRIWTLGSGKSLNLNRNIRIQRSFLWEYSIVGVGGFHTCMKGRSTGSNSSAVVRVCKSYGKELALTKRSVY